jgi:transglutaminase-like putative cysteine protease
LETLERLLTFAHNYLYYKATPTSFTTEEIITNGYGDCTEYTQLLLALLNAAKIPARKVDGYIYLGDDEKRFGGHEWVEVLVDGQWRGIDPTWNLMNTTAVHLPITIDNEKSASDLVFAVKQIHYK